MGRDTGIKLISKKIKFNKSWICYDNELPSYVSLEDETEEYKIYEKDSEIGELAQKGYSVSTICYWRKIHSIADGINKKLDYKDCEYIELTKQNLIDIRDIIIETIKHPDTFISNIWEYNDMKNHLCQDVTNITFIIDNMGKDDKVFYYDSI